MDLDKDLKRLVIDELRKLARAEPEDNNLLGFRDGPGNSFYADTTEGVTAGTIYMEEENLVIRVKDGEFLIPFNEFLKPN